MAIVKFVPANCPMNNIFPYVMREEATEAKLIDGIECSPDTALEEFRYVKQRFHKEGGRQYYHVIQAFAPEDPVTPEMAHEIGMELAMYFDGYQAVVATHINKAHIHNHIILNSVSMVNGKKIHQSRDDMLKVKEYSNKLCRKRGLSVTEVKSSAGDIPQWKRLLCGFIRFGMGCTATKGDFILWMERHGYKVKWEPDYKYITFTTPDGIKCRDNKLFDERFLKNNMELYYAMGGCNSYLADTYDQYKTPAHKPDANMTVTTGLVNLLGNILSSVPSPDYYTPRPLTEMDWQEKERLERLLGRRISPQAYICYCTQDEYEQENGLHW